MPTSITDIKRALARIRELLPAEKRIERKIRLGLDRVRRVVPAKQDWIGVHVAGTNGKGSICTLLAGMLRRAGIGHGVFLSPAMPEPHNGVLINGRYANRRMYELERDGVQAAYSRVSSGWTFATGETPDDLTPFELQTATAFRVFDKMHVKYGIVEVGMGGSTDATNVMREKAVTIISRIGLDHQEYLGGTIEEIARVKAGIMRQGVPCIVDPSNPDEVMRVLSEEAYNAGTQITMASRAEPLLAGLDRDRFRLEPYEERNLLCALLAFQKLFPNLKMDVNELVSTDSLLPGRKEKISVTGLTGGLRRLPILVDGAHNMLGFEALAAHVQGSVRQGDEPVTWVMALSSSTSKPFAKMMETLVQPQDRLAFVEYVAQDGDPPPTAADLGRDLGRIILRDDQSQLYDGDPSVGAGVVWACTEAGKGPVVVTGSLYMIRDLYQLEGVEPSRKIGTMRPGPSQLWHYTRLAQERTLTADEESEFKRARRHNHLSPRRSHVFRHVRDGGQPKPVPVPDSVRQAQRTAAYHKKQADGCKVAIESMREDRKKSSSDGHLDKTMKELQRKQQEHLREYRRTMLRVRGRNPDPNRKFTSYQDIFRKAKPSKQTAKPNSNSNVKPRSWRGSGRRR
ncbi:hypothetical protein CDD80_6351 [Ophiocordyceps camponoti-rufipedis]|uniref:Mur ligase central domain-containing protein n=1 Tax=Ophiocordyceps camponoti-rufipedis TaxID=2004952 RepID=A0A2C5YK99_9HYPO|nr:hypothetical protein CDD80_6351 [Ophiocordyceps camponoti-rufipedis]